MNRYTVWTGILLVKIDFMPNEFKCSAWVGYSAARGHYSNFIGFIVRAAPVIYVIGTTQLMFLYKQNQC